MAIPQFDVTIKGMALESRGLTEWNTFDGFGLVTQGLIWGCQNIWYGPWNSNGATSISTTWSFAGTTISTSWTLAQGATVSTTWSPFSTYNKEDC